MDFEHFFTLGLSVVTQGIDWDQTPGVSMLALSFVNCVSMSKFN